VTTTDTDRIHDEVDAAIRAHGARAVSRALGLSREAVLSIGGRYAVQPSSLFVARARIDRLRQLGGGR